MPIILLILFLGIGVPLIQGLVQHWLTKKK